MKINFLDTSSLLIQIPKEFFIISSITLQELENIKNSSNKDQDIKQRAREVAAWLVAHTDSYEVSLFKPSMLEFPTLNYYELNNDIKILATAMDYYGIAMARDSEEIDFTFYTNDNCLYLLAKNYLPKVERINDDKDKYNGIREVTLSDEEMSEYYSNLSSNVFNLYIGEYLIIKNEEGEIVDKACWTGEEMRPLRYDDFTSKYFGKVKPKSNDPYQVAACDSLRNNKLTVLRGPAGSGKSQLALGYLFSLLDNDKIDKIVMFVNPVAERNSCKFGFLPGTLLEKILGSQIGNFLASKLGSIEMVYNLIEQGKIEFIATADARGYEALNTRCAIYMTEAQNTTIDMMKLLLERFGEDTIGVFEGDTECQVDNVNYENGNNGLKRLCEVYKGEPYFGTVTLVNCYRSKIAKHALNM